MRKVLKATIRTSLEIKEFRDNRLHHALFDEKQRRGEMPDPLDMEAEMLVSDIMDKLSFLKPAIKHSSLYGSFYGRRCGNGSVEMVVGMYSDQQHDLDEFARSLGFRNWKVAVIVYYALKLEDERKCGKRL